MNEAVTAVLPLVVFFGGLYAFVKISQFRRSRSRETVDPHVVRPVTRQYADRSHTIYKCELCGKERELKGYFKSEDCEEFEANQ